MCFNVSSFGVILVRFKTCACDPEGVDCRDIPGLLTFVETTVSSLKGFNIPRLGVELAPGNNFTFNAGGVDCKVAIGHPVFVEACV